MSFSSTKMSSRSTKTSSSRFSRMSSRFSLQVAIASASVFSMGVAGIRMDSALLQIREGGNDVTKPASPEAAVESQDTDKKTIFQKASPESPVDVFYFDEDKNIVFGKVIGKSLNQKYNVRSLPAAKEVQMQMNTENALKGLSDHKDRCSDLESEIGIKNQEILSKDSKNLRREILELRKTFKRSGCIPKGQWNKQRVQRKVKKRSLKKESKKHTKQFTEQVVIQKRLEDLYLFSKLNVEVSKRMFVTRQAKVVLSTYRKKEADLPVGTADESVLDLEQEPFEKKLDQLKDDLKGSKFAAAQISIERGLKTEHLGTIQVIKAAVPGFTGAKL